MVGYSMGSAPVDPGPPPRQAKICFRNGSDLPQQFLGVKEKSGNPCGLSELCFSSGPSSQMFPERLYESQQGTCSQILERQEVPVSTLPQTDPQTLVKEGPFQKDGPFDTSPSVDNDSHRCLKDGLGRLCVPIPTIPGTLVSVVPEVPHQLPRAVCSVSYTQEGNTEKTFPHPLSPGQYDRGGLSQERGFEIPNPEPDLEEDLRATDAEVLALFCDSSCGSEECDSRFSFEGFDSGGRVVPFEGGLPAGSPGSPRSPGRSLCHSEQSPAPLLHDAGPRPTIPGVRCVNSRLEPVGQDIPVSPGEYPHEGPSPPTKIQGDSGFDSSAMAREPMVSGSDGSQPSSSSGTVPGLMADSSGSDMLRFLLSDPPPSYLDFLTKIYGKEFSQENVESMTSSLRSSSNRQYQSNWNRWVLFCRDRHPSVISRDFLASFLRHLFFEKKLSVATIRSQKSSLRDPIRLAFGIDLSDDIFGRILRSFSLSRPAPRSQTISWSLDNVLHHLSTIDTMSCSYADLLDKTIFLIALASGNRVSETHALYRGSLSTRLEGDSLVLVPKTDFLAKNEDPQHRRPPLRIRPLKENRSLCPVDTTRCFLYRSSDILSGPLFTNVSGEALSQSQIRYRLTRLIKRTNPDSIPKSHDMRKVSFS